jgi:hypothetical protein
MSGMVSILHKEGFVYKQTTLIPSKYDAQAQKAFKEGYEKLYKKLKIVVTRRRFYFNLWSAVGRRLYKRSYPVRRYANSIQQPGFCYFRFYRIIDNGQNILQKIK